VFRLEERTNEHDHRRQGELHGHRPLLRRPWIGLAGCADSRLAAERVIVGEAKNKVPTLILHGDADRILPPDATARRQAKMIKNVKFVELPGGPHGVLWTHADRINAELVRFLA
jgi:non-heme chloroperoxidase